MEVLKYIDQLKNKNNKTFDGLSTYIINKIKTQLSLILTKVINKSFRDGKVPKLMKKSRVVPVFKKGLKYLCSNYRPISILPALSKLLEMAVKVRTVAFLDYHNFFAPMQYGFRKKTNTETAAVDLGQYLGVKVQMDNIDTAHRLPTRAKDAARPILVKFVNRWCKDLIMEKIIQMNKAKDPLTTVKLNYPSPCRNVYVSEHLIPNLQKLHAEARMMKREKKIAKVYVRNGKILVKKTDEIKNTHITCSNDLKKLVDGE